LFVCFFKFYFVFILSLINLSLLAREDLGDGGEEGMGGELALFSEDLGLLGIGETVRTFRVAEGLSTAKIHKNVSN